MKDAGLYEIEHYIQQRRDTISRFVKNRDIYKKCLDLDVDGRYKQQFWWSQSFNLND